MVPEGKARSEEIAEGAHVGVVHVNGSLICALESDLRVRVGAKVANDSQIAVDVESEGSTATIHPHQPVSGGQRRHRAQIGVTQKQLVAGNADVQPSRIRHGCLHRRARRHRNSLPGAGCGAGIDSFIVPGAG